MTLIILICGCAVMFAADSLFRIATVISGMFGSSAALFWAQWWWWRINIWSWVSAMVGGPIVYFLLGWLLPNWPWWRHQLATSEAAVDTLVMLQAMIAIVITTCLWMVVALVTKPESDETLKRFYCQARPLGAWGYVRRLVEREPNGTPLPPKVRGLLLGGLIVAVVCAAWISLGVLGLSQLAVGEFGAGTVMIASAIVVAFVFRRAFAWHMTRLEAD